MQQILLRENKIDRSKEHFWVACLSNNNRILLIELVSLGTMKASLVDPTEVFSFALQKRAVQSWLNRFAEVYLYSANVNLKVTLSCPSSSSRCI
jgi:hypothetical protein